MNRRLELAVAYARRCLRHDDPIPLDIETYLMANGILTADLEATLED